MKLVKSTTYPIAQSGLRQAIKLMKEAWRAFRNPSPKYQHVYDYQRSADCELNDHPSA